MSVQYRSDILTEAFSDEWDLLATFRTDDFAYARAKVNERTRCATDGDCTPRTLSSGCTRRSRADQDPRIFPNGASLVGMVATLLQEQDDVRVGMMTDSPGMPPATMCPPAAVWLTT